MMRALLVIVLCFVFECFAGGPLLVTASGPVRWARREISGGPLKTTTVDAQARVVYRVDSGPLGPLSNAQAVKLVDRIFKLYNDIPTCTLEFVNGGSILDPATGRPIDITGANAGLVLSSRNPTFQNPIVFDSDGSITGQGGVLGFFSFLQVKGLELHEGLVVLNGSAVSRIGEIPFLGVFTHEFGHFAGPLDHSQINGWIASGDSRLVFEGFTAEQRYDLFAPFTETVYPFLFSNNSSRLASLGFGNSGYFIASLHFDDVVAMSTLYPAAGYLPSESGSPFGGISGRIIVDPLLKIPLSGLNVVARRVDRGRYPPSPTTKVYLNDSVPLDADGVPLLPEDRPELDPLATATSLVNGMLAPDGRFAFVGLPPGEYSVYVETINPNALGGSSIGFREPQLSFITAEYWNGQNESADPATDKPLDFTPVKVTAGAVTTGIEILLNGFATTVASNEAEPNDKVKKAQVVAVDSILTGQVAVGDKAKVKVDFGRSGSVDVQDLYKVQVSANSVLLLMLDALEGTSDADIDLYCFLSDLKNGTVSINSQTVLGASFSPANSEVITVGVAPGTYFLGVSSAAGSAKYRLAVYRKKN
ncbi:MAG: hypothetical protein RMM17_03565 [Acidobacteriota bacterium]|nr:hypothetical protein [Blastocatellia bacterium]MDW8411746.1 hypothetical protein [Acidobacteriota bacterium]